MAVSTNADKSIVDASGKLLDNTGKGSLGSVSKIASSLFLTAPDPSITKANASGQTPTKIDGQLQLIGGSMVDNLIKKITSKTGGIFGENFSLMDIVDAVSFDKGFDLDFGQLTQRMGGLVGSATDIYQSGKSIIDDVKKDALGAITKYAGGLGLGDMSNYLVMGANAVKIAKETDWHDLGSLLGGASKLLGKDFLGAFIDIQAETGLIMGLIEKAQKLKLPEAIAKLGSKLKSAKAYKSVIARNIRVTVKASDTSTLDLITKVIEGKALLSEYPELITDYLKHYHLPTDYRYEDFPKYREQIVNLLKRLNPTWDKVLWGDQWVYDLKPWSLASKDILLLFRGTEWEQSMMVSPKYPSQEIKGLMKNTYRHYYG